MHEGEHIQQATEIVNTHSNKLLVGTGRSGQVAQNLVLVNTHDPCQNAIVRGFGSFSNIGM